MNDVINTLIVVDFQYDFIEGALAVPGANEDDFLHRVYKFVNDWDGPIVFSRDWHPVNHCSFADPPAFVDQSWPAHCVKGTAGAQIMLPVTGLIVSKGINPEKEAYSAFDGDVNLGGWLRSNRADGKADEVVVIGLALDYCVKATALDAAAMGFDTTVLLDMTLPVAPSTGIAAMAELRGSGVHLMDADGTPR